MQEIMLIVGAVFVIVVLLAAVYIMCQPRVPREHSASDDASIKRWRDQQADRLLDHD